MKKHKPHYEPPIGAFIRPIGHYAYCLEVREVNEYINGTQRAYKRWGMRDGQPFDDGHRCGFSYLNDLEQVIAGAWKQPAYNGYEAVYWKLICIPQPATGQQNLF